MGVVINTYKLFLVTVFNIKDFLFGYRKFLILNAYKITENYDYIVLNRTVNRHRWLGRVYQGDWEKGIEGTRQNGSVTSGERVPFWSWKLFRVVSKGLY